MMVSLLALFVAFAKTLASLLPAGPQTPTPGTACGQSSFVIAISNIDYPQNEHSTDVVNGWEVFQGNQFAGWIAKTRNGKLYYLNPIAFDSFQEITDSNQAYIINKKLNFVGCFKYDYKDI